MTSASHTVTIDYNTLLAEIQRINGAAEYNETKVVDEVPSALSSLYLPQDYAVHVNSAAKVAQAQDFPLHVVMQIVYLNWIALMRAKMSPQDAMLVARLRAGIIQNGGFWAKEPFDDHAMNTFLPEIFYVALPEGVSIHPVKVTVQPPRSKDRPDEPVPTVDLDWDADQYYAALAAGQVRGYKGLTMKLKSDENMFDTLYQSIEANGLALMVKYLPVFAHMAFTKFEHHYIDNQFFRDSYAKQFKSLKLEALAPVYNHARIIYNSVHWMGPRAMKEWSKNLLEGKRMARGAAIKFPLIPAGTAAIASCVAVLNAAKALPGFSAFFDVYKQDWETALQAVSMIKANPYAYHVRADLYGEESHEANLAPAKLAIQSLAPAAQAFVNKFCQGTDFARIQALKKYAEQNIGLLRRYETIFTGAQAQMRAAAKSISIAQLLTSAARAQTATVEEAEEEVV